MNYLNTADALPPHLTHIQQLNAATIHALIASAKHHLTLMKSGQTNPFLSGKVIANLFFEPSTRTRYSFALAAQRLGAILLNPEMSTSSMTKGETLLDTIASFQAMGTDLFVLRHSENHTPEFISQSLTDKTKLINAGDGNHQHPTQALLDLMTIAQNKTDFTRLNVAIIGDIKHSRVASSLIQGLHLMSVQSVRLIAPNALLPDDKLYSFCKRFDRLSDGLTDVDVIICLRIQKERIPNDHLPDIPTFHQQYGLTLNALKFAKHDAIIMHPGPINPGIEIDQTVATCSQSKILDQVQNGVAMRMALLNSMLNH